MNQENLLSRLNTIRSKDDLNNPQFQEELLKQLFPETTEELVLDLSNVTSAFYGLLLKNIGNEFGLNKIDKISRDTFYEIGIIKSKQCLEKIDHLPIDTRAFLIVLISAIYNASPEYNYKVIEFSPQKTVFELNGVDRYYRILKNLEIEDHITFPTLKTFMMGIKDFLNIKCSIDINFEVLNDKEFKTKHIYSFTLNYE